MKIWITKYALTRGIVETTLAPGTSLSEDGHMVKVKWKGGMNGTALFFREGEDWHTTHVEAVARAEEKRARKIASLKKKIAKLEALRWRNP